MENAGIFSEKAGDQPRPEVVHVVAARLGAPFGVVLQQFDIQPVQATGGLDVKGTFADLLDGGDACERQEEAEMVVEIGIGTGDGRIVGGEVFGLERLAIGCQDEAGFALGRSGAGAQDGEGGRGLARRAGGDVEVVGLKDAAKV